MVLPEWEVILLLSMVQRSLLITTSPPVQFGEEGNELSVMEKFPLWESIGLYPVFGHLPMGVFTLLMTTMFTLDKVETALLLVQILPEFVHPETAARPVITGLAPEP